MKIIFMGTPEFAAAALKRLMEAHEVLAVVTQPDRPKGRGKKLQPPPVKEAALEKGIKVYQPEKIKKEGFISVLKQYDADVFVVAAYGQLLSEEILYLPKYGSINIHASLLPKYRGASPIQQALINGDVYSGITIMQMDKGLDTGDMILKKETEILPEDNFQTLHDKLALLGGDAIIEALDLIEKGDAERIKQEDSLSTYAPLIKKEDGIIDWSQNAETIINKIRGFDPWPAAFSYMNGEMLKIFKAELTEGYDKGSPGEIIDILKSKGIVVKTGDGAVVLTEIQALNKKRMLAADYLRGHEILKNTILENK